jgi:hypothetical protein
MKYCLVPNLQFFFLCDGIKNVDKSMFSANVTTITSANNNELIYNMNNIFTISQLNKKDIHVYLVTDKSGRIVFGCFNTLNVLKSFKILVGNCGFIYKVSDKFQFLSSNKKINYMKASTFYNKLQMKGMLKFFSESNVSADILTDIKYFSCIDVVKTKSENTDNIVEIKRVKQELESNSDDVNIDLGSPLSYLQDERYITLFNDLKEAKFLLDNLIQSESQLTKTISMCDLETLNLLHHLELDFSGMNACDVYYKGKQIHNVREVRRNAKDKLYILNSMYAEYQTFYLTFEKLLSELEGREYTDRQTYGMFDDSVLHVTKQKSDAE